MAQDEGTPDERARAAFDAGVADYEAGRFVEAEAKFQRAYRLTGRIELLYNIYLARRDSGNLEGARDALREFVVRRELPPEAPQARRLAALEARLASGETEDVPAAGAETQPAVESSAEASTGGAPAGGDEGSISIPGVILVAVGGAALIAGAALVGVAFADEAAIENPDGMPAWSTETQAAADRVPILAVAGEVALGVGVAALAVGIVLMVIDTGGGDSTALLRDGRLEARF